MSQYRIAVGAAHKACVPTCKLFGSESWVTSTALLMRLAVPRSLLRAFTKLTVAQGHFVEQYLAFQAAKDALQASFDECSADLDKILPMEFGPPRRSSSWIQ